MIYTLATAIKIALFVVFLAVLSSLVETGAKIFGVTAPTMPTIPASFQLEAGGEYANGQAEVAGSFAFGIGGSQTASQTLSTPSLGSQAATHTVASLPKHDNTQLAGLTGNTASPGRFGLDHQKGKQLPAR